MTISNLLKSTALGTATIFTLGVAATSVNAKDYSMTSSTYVTPTYSYVAYDTNRDGRMNEDEFMTYSYNNIDVNSDNLIDENEWNDYTSIWYEPYDIDADTAEFSSYDTDNDGFIEMSEYESSYDSDLYTYWDSDNDGFIETNEYEQVANNYVQVDTNDVYTW